LAPLAYSEYLVAFVLLLTSQSGKMALIARILSLVFIFLQKKIKAAGNQFH
jgi:hypothetical protein